MIKAKILGLSNFEDLPKASDLKQKMKESCSFSIGDTHNLGAYDRILYMWFGGREVTNVDLSHLRYKSLLLGKAMEMEV